MMMTMCSKFGTGGFGVEVGSGTVVGTCVGAAGDGRGVTVGAGGVEVGVIAGVPKQASRFTRIRGMMKKSLVLMFV
jgi:hypothetical protein